MTGRHLNFEALRYDWLLDHSDVWSRVNVKWLLNDSAGIIHAYGAEIGVTKLTYGYDASLHHLRDENIELHTLLHVVTEEKARHARLEKKSEGRIEQRLRKQKLAVNAAKVINAAYTSGKIQYAISVHNGN